MWSHINLQKKIVQQRCYKMWSVSATISIIININDIGSTWNSSPALIIYLMDFEWGVCDVPTNLWSEGTGSHSSPAWLLHDCHPATTESINESHSMLWLPDAKWDSHHSPAWAFPLNTAPLALSGTMEAADKICCTVLVSVSGTEQLCRCSLSNRDRWIFAHLMDHPHICPP